MHKKNLKLNDLQLLICHKNIQGNTHTYTHTHTDLYIFE